MALNIEAFENWTFPSLSQSYTDKDTMLYAVSIGFGQDPLSPLELPFVFEEGLKAVPSFAAILCHPGAWSSDPAFGVTRHRVVHGEQRIFMHQPLPPEGTLFAHASVYGVEDKGEKGAIIHAARTLSDHQTKLPIVSVLHSSFARADGGFGKNLGKKPEPTSPCPATAPDLEIDIVTRPEQALLYRLNLDRNPLHASPTYAARAGFERPILHGLCTYGLAARALLLTVANGDPDILRSIECRFSRPVFPGETVRFQFWRQPDAVSFRARVETRDVTVLDSGRALLGGGHETPDWARCKVRQEPES